VEGRRALSARRQPRPRGCPSDLGHGATGHARRTADRLRRGPHVSPVLRARAAGWPSGCWRRSVSPIGSSSGLPAGNVAAACHDLDVPPLGLPGGRQDLYRLAKVLRGEVGRLVRVDPFEGDCGSARTITVWKLWPEFGNTAGPWQGRCRTWAAAQRLRRLRRSSVGAPTRSQPVIGPLSKVNSSTHAESHRSTNPMALTEQGTPLPCPAC
jgi:hypothetical protein